MAEEKTWTQVANGYSEDIYAKVTVNIDVAMARRLKEMVQTGCQLGLFEKGSSDNDGGNDNSLGEKLKHFHQNPGFVKIAPGKFTDFLMNGPDGKVFVTVKTRSEVVADNFPIANSRGIVVDSEGCVFKTRPKTVWIDQYGNSHKPSNR